MKEQPQNDMDFMFGPTGPQNSGYIWVVDFDDHTLASFYSQFFELEKDPSVSIIPIFISSYGGSVDVLTAMRDLIKSCDKPVATIAVGRAMSCGAALLAAGTPGFRFAAPNASIMIHEVSGGAGGKSAEMEARIEDIKRINEQLFAHMAQDMKVPYAKLLKEVNKRRNADWFITAEEALKLKLIDHVGLPRVMMKVQSYLALGDRK